MKPAFFTILIFILGLFTVLAQDSAYSACDDLAERLTTIQQNTAALDASSETLSEEIASLQTELSALDSACRGLSFNSDDEGLQPVIGPILLEEGVYRLTFTTDGFGAIDGTMLDGDCEREINVIFNEGRGDAEDGAQQVLQLDEDCEFLLEFSNITEDWTFTIEKLQ
jgi:hypothetical protein